MHIKATFALLLSLILSTLIKAQVGDTPSFKACLADHIHAEMLVNNPDYASKHQAVEKQIYDSYLQANSSTVETNTLQTIPVVVHVVHDYGPENISDAQVNTAIQYLNEAFANMGYFDPNTGINVEIDFCLAVRDPQNNPSSGINRLASPLTDVTFEIQDLELKSNQWNPLDYLNIWVVRDVKSLLIGSSVGAYAYLPAAHGLPRDGIVIESGFFGATADSTKVLVHETGHYLGLWHTFKDACKNDDCLADGDRICDTPPDQSAIRIDCDDEINTCTTDEDDTSNNNPFRPVLLGGLGDQNDMFINYMDYSYLPCYSAFTAGQKTRMKTVLSTTRNSLLTSFGCQNPCPLASYEASFSTNPISPVLAGETVAFANTSDPADTYEWRIDNQVFSSNFNSNYVFSEGFFTVNLTIQDTINHCESTTEQIIEAVCDGEASFISDTTDIIIAGETELNFTNTSTIHDSYEWYLDGVLYSTDMNLSIIFPNPGYYTIYLVGVNAHCSNVSMPINIDVGACSTEEYKREMHWYFGNKVALDFNNGEPVFVPGSQMNHFVGAASFSDKDGNLLFYTEGSTIWDASNSVMPNGTGLLGGNGGGNDQVLIVPRPFYPDQYYVVTSLIGFSPSENGVRYSIVDMSLNGGLGDVTDVKNVYIGPPRWEILNAAYHADGERAWLLVESSEKTLTTYLIDSSGFGPPIQYMDDSDTENTSWHNGIFFNSGKKYIIPRFNRSNGIKHLVILDFDNATGVLSNPIAFPLSQNEDAYIHSMALSPDDRKLYVNMDKGVMDDDQNHLFQIYLPLAIGNQLENSNTKIAELSHFDELLLGPNGKIYITRYERQYMSVVNAPNQNGLDCNFESNGLSIHPAINRVDINKFIKGKGFDLGVKEPTIDLGPDRSICRGTTLVLNEEGNKNYNYLWQDGSTDPTFTTWLPGTYTATASNECNSVSDEIRIEYADGLLDLGDDIISKTSVVTLDVGSDWDVHIWQDSSTNSTLEVKEPGTYWVYVRTNEGCFQSDTIEVSFNVPTNKYKSSLVLFPNPSHGLFKLQERRADILNDIEYMIFDALGRKLSQKAAFLDGSLDIDLTDYPSGTYFLHWTTFNDSGVFKLIIAAK